MQRFLNIDSGTGMSPTRLQASIETNAKLFLIESLGTKLRSFQYKYA